MNVELDRGFERTLQEAVLDDVEVKLVGEQASLVYQFVELVHTRLRAYGRRNGYDVKSTIESIGLPEVDRSDDRIAVTVGWASDQMARWEFGTSDHVVDGNPVLAFVWENPPQWVREEFDQARSTRGEFESGWQVFLPQTEPSGLPESRAIRDSIHALRQVVQS